jgi:hypothetical protein
MAKAPEVLLRRQIADAVVPGFASFREAVAASLRVGGLTVKTRKTFEGTRSSFEDSSEYDSTTAEAVEVRNRVKKAIRTWANGL